MKKRTVSWLLALSLVFGAVGFSPPEQAKAATPNPNSFFTQSFLVSGGDTEQKMEKSITNEVKFRGQSVLESGVYDDISLEAAKTEVAAKIKEGYTAKWYYNSEGKEAGYLLYKKSGIQTDVTKLPTNKEKNDLQVQLINRDPSDAYMFSVPVNKVNQPASTSNWNKYGVFSYGDMAEINKENAEKTGRDNYKNGMWRYWGYTANGKLYENDNFPRDNDTGRDPWVKSWLTTKEIDKTAKAAELIGLEVGTAKQPYMPFEVLPTLTKFLELNPGWVKAGWTTSTLYEHFLVTSLWEEEGYTQGQFVGVHQNGGYWYQSFSVPANPVKFITVSYIVKQIEGETIFPPLLEMNNNLIMAGVQFIDSTGKVITNPAANTKYTARFYIEYKGADMPKATTIKIQNGAIRNLKAGSKAYAASPWTASKSVQLKNGSTTYIDVGPVTTTETNIYACATIAPDPVWNMVNTDDFGELELKGIVDNLTMSIQSISPSKVKIYSPQTTKMENFEVIYQINYATNKTDSLASDVDFVLTSSNMTNPRTQTLTRFVEIFPGTNTYSFQSGLIDIRNANSSISFTMSVNNSREHPLVESTYADNTDSVKVPIQSINSVMNPCTGTIHNTNSWPVTYNVTTKTGSVYGYHGSHYHSYRCGCKYTKTGKRYGCKTCYRSCSCCSAGTTRDWTQNSTRTEKFEITAINFTSKDTKYQPVNLIHKNGLIKAGYGFEMEIIAKYTGTESPARPVEKGRCNYQNVFPAAY